MNGGRVASAQTFEEALAKYKDGLPPSFPRRRQFGLLFEL